MANAMIQDIVTYPNPVLEQYCSPWAGTDAELEDLRNKLIVTLSATPNGIGLAACQIGVPTRVAVIKTPDMTEYALLVNPSIVSFGDLDKKPVDEGCLSIPLNGVETSRYNVVEFESGVEGKRITQTYKGLAARAIQHEVDHMGGILIVKYTDERNAKRIKSRVSKWKAKGIHHPQGAGRMGWVAE